MASLQTITHEDRNEWSSLLLLEAEGGEDRAIRGGSCFTPTGSPGTLYMPHRILESYSLEDRKSNLFYHILPITSWECMRLQMSRYTAIVNIVSIRTYAPCYQNNRRNDSVCQSHSTAPSAVPAETATPVCADTEGGRKEDVRALLQLGLLAGLQEGNETGQWKSQGVKHPAPAANLSISHDGTTEHYVSLKGMQHKVHNIVCDVF